MSDIIQVEYLKKARSAYANQEFRLCLILLKKVIINETSISDLSVNCAYDLWKFDLSEDFKQTSEYADNLQLVKESFTHLLSNHKKPLEGSKQVSIIRAYDYIRLSHIYLSEVQILVIINS
jgi:hypothetical protein